MKKKNFDIAQIIASYLSGEITEGNQQILDSWLKESEGNVSLFEKIVSKDNREAKRGSFNSYSANSGWLKLEKDISRFNSRTIFLRVVKYAAVILAPVVLGVLLFLSKETPQKSVVADAGIVAGGPKAKLILADGSVMDLAKENGFELEEKDGTNVSKDNSILSYNAAEKETDKAKIKKVLYNTVETPRGGEYVLKLSDGTRVYLNAMSRFKFPVQFTGKYRKVELEGQAYFEVAKDKNHPFIVKTNNINVRVLGTSFDVCSYKDDENVITTLVEGSVNINAVGENNPIALKPNDQAVYSKVKREVNVKHVDARYYTAWKDGKFKFRDERLEDILKVISRWYDVDVYFFNSDVKDLLFGCHVNRYDSIEPLLKIFESTEKIKIDVRKKSLIVKQVR